MELVAGGLGDIPPIKQLLFATSNVFKHMQYETSVGSLILQRTERESSHYSINCCNEYFWEYFPSPKFCHRTSVGQAVLERTEREGPHYSINCWNEYFWEYFPSKKFCHRTSVGQAVLERTEREDPLHSLRASCPTLSKGIHPLYSVISHYPNKFYLYGKIILNCFPYFFPLSPEAIFPRIH